MIYDSKTVKINKKFKTKTLKKVIDACLKKKFDIGLNGDVSIEDDSFNHIRLDMKFFDSEVKIDKVELDYDEDGKITEETYYMGDDSINKSMLFLFTSPPKLTKKQRKAPVRPPEPKVVKVLEGDKTGYFYDMEFKDDDQLYVGCAKFNKEQMTNLFSFIGDCLGYDIED